MFNFITSIAYWLTDQAPVAELTDVIANVISFVDIVFGVIWIVIGWFILQNKDWARTLGLFLSGASVALNAFTLISAGGIDFIRTVLAVIILVLLIKSRKK